MAEGLPLIALESMASGTPVITSDSAGMVEAVGDAGLVVPGGDPAGMAAHVARLAGSEPERLAAVQNSLLRSHESSWDRVAATFAGMAPIP